MPYPSIQQYQEALQHPSTAFTDPTLARGKIRTSGLGTPIVVSGGFALTYAVETRGTKYAVRCFHREAKGLEKRYAAIAAKLKSLSSPYFLDFQFLPTGVRANGAAYPAVKMAWGSGETLGEFVEDCHDDRAKLTNLISAFTKLATFLEQQGIAHGDIQEGNVMVSDAGRHLQLIDYDGMYVPELAALGGAEFGHRDYQHPARNDKVFDNRLDRFSFIALNLALRALCEMPSLWRSSQSGAGVILFRANDFADPGSSKVISNICKITSLQREAKNFASICAGRYSDIPSLSDFLAGRNIPQAATQVSSHTQTAMNAHVPAAQIGYISQYPVLDAKDFSAFARNVGQMVELVGKIVAVKLGFTRRGSRPYIFINFAHWQGQAVKITLWSEALTRGGPQPDESWVGQWVTIKGLVEPSFAKRGYEHISITAASLSQVSQLKEADAQYRLTPRRPVAATPPPTINKPTNADILIAIQKPSPPVTRPSVPAPTSPPVPVPAPATSNQQNLDRLRQQGGAIPSPRGAAPAPSTAPQWPGTVSQQPKGLFQWMPQWLRSLFR